MLEKAGIAKTERERWVAVLAPKPKPAVVCCNHNCKQGDTCPLRQRLKSEAVLGWIIRLLCLALVLFFAFQVAQLAGYL